MIRFVGFGLTLLVAFALRPSGPGVASGRVAEVSGRPWVQSAQGQQRVFRGDADTVAVYATVHDRAGRLVPDLTKDSFRVFDDGTEVKIQTFSNDQVPFIAVLMLDVSDSFTPPYFRVKSAAQAFVLALGDGDRLRIGSFGREVALSPWLTGDRAVLLRVLDEEIWPGGGTPLWRASKAAMDSLVDEVGHRVVLLLTDGVDRGLDFDCAPTTRNPLGPIGPCPGRDDVHTQAMRSGFMFYAVGMEGASVDAGLTSLVEDTGGGHFDVQRNDDLAETFQRVADELHHQYAIGFAPTALDGRTHRLEVRLTLPGLTARTRKSYVAEARK